MRRAEASPPRPFLLECDPGVSAAAVNLATEKATVSFDPGGIAPAGATPALTDSCRVALADGTRGGLVLTFLFYGWASVHYFLAAIGMGQHLRVRT